MTLIGKLQQITINVFLSVSLLCSMVSLGVKADDTEIYLDQEVLDASRPNILFVVDLSERMENEIASGDASITQLIALKQSLRTVVRSAANMNIGLVTFSGDEATLVRAAGNVSVNAHKNRLVKSINAFTAAGEQPTMLGLTRALQYLTGNSSPINNACQSNHVILLTDRLPTDVSIEAEAFFESLTGQTCINALDCLTNTVEHIVASDQSNTVEGNQNIIFHAVGINAEIPEFDILAQLHPEGYYIASTNKTDLQESIQVILSSIERGASSFVSPGVSVSQSNSISHSNNLYYSLFQPRGNAVWAGNLKKYQLVNDQIVGKNGVPVIKDGVFNPDTQNLWSSFVDGDQITRGGAANKFGDSDNEETAPTRDIYTNFSGNNDVNLSAQANHLNENNQNALEANIVEDDDDDDDNNQQGSIFQFLLDLIKWARGVDVDDEFDSDDDEDGIVSSVDDIPDDNARKIMGDSLHSRPTVVSYANENGPIDIVFAATNEGYLHAIKGEEGEEVWSFLPLTLLKDVERTKSKELTAIHQYGLDGAIVPFIDDTNKNGLLDKNENGYLMIGMRRGGNQYYMLDISNMEKPVLKYIIDGNAADFNELGQTWSKPILGYVNWNNTRRKVAIFGGGYDPQNQDFYGGGSNDSVGATIYMVDLETGEKLWDAAKDAQDSPIGVAGSLKNMTNGFTADLAVINLSGSGLFEVIYAVDIRGQVFRFDLNNVDNNGDAKRFAIGGRIASLGGDGNNENRRFYNAPDISSVRRPNGESYLSISLGSGYRAHPKETTIQDYFFVVRDSGVLRKKIVNDQVLSDFTADISLDNLLDITDLSSGEVDQNGDTVSIAQHIDADPDLQGWFLALGQGTGTNGEKVLANSTTFNDRLLFTTYLPMQEQSAANNAICQMNYGKSRTYAISVVDGTPVQADGSRFIENQLSGIAPEPTILFVADPNRPNSSPDPVVIVGADTPFDRGNGDSQDLLGLSGKRLETRKWEELESK